MSIPPVSPTQPAKKPEKKPEKKIELKEMTKASVIRAYANWAPVYDWTFGRIVGSGRRRALAEVNRCGEKGRVLEVGVGTGLALPGYAESFRVTGVDLSAEMLSRARLLVEKRKLSHVESLEEMDAANLRFEDESFDIVTAFYVLTTVPDPPRTLDEMARVCRSGGHVFVLGHFSVEGGIRGWGERFTQPLALRIGWRPEFPLEVCMGCPSLRLESQRTLNPFRLFTLLHFRKI